MLPDVTEDVGRDAVREAVRVPVGAQFAAFFLSAWGSIVMIGGLLASVLVLSLIVTASLNEDRAERWHSWLWLLPCILMTFLALIIGRLALLVAEQIRHSWNSVIEPRWRTPWWPPFFRDACGGGWATAWVVCFTYGFGTALISLQRPTLLWEAVCFILLGSFCFRRAWRGRGDQGTSSGGKMPMDESS